MPNSERIAARTNIYLFVCAAFFYLLMSQQTIDHHFRARIQVVDVRDLPGFPEDIEDPFVFVSESSNNNLDWYYTHMTEATLRNFAADAADGVQFLDSHNAGNLGYGRTFDGRFEVVADRRPDFSLPEGLSLAIDPPTQYMRALLSTFTVPGIRFGGRLTYASTDDFIRAARAQIAKDISVGFGGGRWICDICGGDYRSYQSCPHIAGFQYPMGEQGERVVVATVAIDGARLLEHSAVYDGACPDAMIVKAERMAQAGEMEPEKKAAFERRYKVELPTRFVSAGVSILDARDITASSSSTTSTNIAWHGAPIEGEGGQDNELANGRLADDQKGGKRMPEDNQEVEAELLVAERDVEFLQMRTAVDEARTIAHSVQGMPEGATLTDAVRWLAGQVNELRGPAADGRQYRADLIAAALAEGVRAHGEHFAEETYGEMLRGLSLEAIKRMRDDWGRVAEQRFQPGRSVQDSSESQPESGRKNRGVPDAAYAA